MPTRNQMTLVAAAALLAASSAAAQSLPDGVRRPDVLRANSVTPTTQSAHDPADAILDRLLGPSTSPSTTPSNDPVVPPATRSVAPDVGPVRLLREGTFVVDRTGVVRRLDDGSLLFVFDADGVGPNAAGDPPMQLVPNLNLMAVESATRDRRDRRFRVTGRVTEYRSRNHLILEKVIVLD